VLVVEAEVGGVVITVTVLAVELDGLLDVEVGGVPEVDDVIDVDVLEVLELELEADVVLAGWTTSVALPVLAALLESPG